MDSNTFSFSEPLRDEDSLIYALLDAETSSSASPEHWAAFFEAAARDERTSEVAQSFARLAGARKLKTYPAACIAEFFYRAGLFADERMSDVAAAREYMEKAIVAFPGHLQAFDHLDGSLTAAGEWRRAGDMAWNAARTASKDRAVELYRRAAECYVEAEQEPERVEKALLEVLKANPSDADSRQRLEEAYQRSGKLKDLAKLLEQTLAATLAEDEALNVRSRLVDLYANSLREAERALPHVERLLAVDPDNAEARAIAESMLVSRGFASRAALILAEVSRVPGREEDLLRYLAVELEHTRGAKRRDLLKEIAKLKEEAATDLRGAMETYEAALMLEPADGEVRERFKALALTLGSALDGARALIRIAPSVKDPAIRAYLTVDTGELLLGAGDSKRARASLLSVLPMQGVDEPTVVRAAELLLDLARSEGDTKLRLDMLERIVGLEHDAECREDLTLELAELATQAQEPSRAALAWKRLLHSSRREEALIALEPLFEQTHNHEELVVVLEERAKSDDRALSQVLLLKAAQVLAHQVHNETRARDVLKRCLERFGPDRDVLREYMPLLESAYEWEALAEAMGQDAALATNGEQGKLYAALGLFHLQRTRKFAEAFDAFSLALENDPNEPDARAKLEGLLVSPEHRLRAAKLLEPVCRQGDALPLLVRVLEARGASESDAAERLAALSEAAEIAERLGLQRWTDLTVQALGEAAGASLNLDYWVSQTERAFVEAHVPAQRQGEILKKALGTMALTSSAHRRLATCAATAYENAGDPTTAVELLRRVLEVEPSDEVLARIDQLLGSGGNAAERVALYEEALRRSPQTKHAELLRSIGNIQLRELEDNKRALTTFLKAYELEPGNLQSVSAIEQILHATDRSALLSFYGKHLAAVDPGDQRDLRLRAALLALSLSKRDVAVQHASALLEGNRCDTVELDALDAVEKKASDREFSVRYFEERIRLSDSEHAESEWRERRATPLAALGKLDAATHDLRFVAALALRGGDAERVRSLLRTIEPWQPNDLGLQREIATLSAQLEDYAALTRELELLLTRSEGDEYVQDALWLSRVYADGVDNPAMALETVAKAYAKRPERHDIVSVFETRIGACHAPTVVENAIEASEKLVFQGEVLKRIQKDRVALLMRAGAAPDRVAKALRVALENASLTAGEFAGLTEAFEQFLLWESLGDNGKTRERRYLRECIYARLTYDEPRKEHLLGVAREEEHDAAYAYGIYERLLQLDADHGDALRGAVRCAKQLGKVDEALAYLERLHTLANEGEKVGFAVEIAALQLDHRDDAKSALSLLEEVAPIAPEHPAVRELLRRMVARADAAESAVKLLLRAASAAEEKGHVDAELGLLDLVLETRVGPSRDSEQRKVLHVRRIARAFALGDARRELEANLAAARENPANLELWDRAEMLARDLREPDAVARAYREVIDTELAAEVLASVGPKAVEFQEEWFDDSKEKVELLQRIFAADPREPWAFDRLKLVFDAEERWSDLFALYDTSIAHAEPSEKGPLLEDIAHIAKDFAKDGDRAIAYFEALLQLKPALQRVETTLERLYEKAGAYPRLVALHRAVRERSSGEARHGLSLQIAKLEVEQLGALDAAMGALHEVPPTIGDPRLEPILEQLVKQASPTLQYHFESATFSVRHAAAERLADRYRAAQRDRDYLRVRVVALEVCTERADQVRLHIELRDLAGKLGEAKAQFEHAASLLELEPTASEHVDTLLALGDGYGRNADVVTLLKRASETQVSPEDAARLWLSAAMVSKKNSEALSQTADLLQALVEREVAPRAYRLAATEELIVLDGRAPGELLWALERKAALLEAPDDKCAALQQAGLQAERAGEPGRAIASWEGVLAVDASNRVALDHLVDLYEQTSDAEPLVRTLRRRAASKSPNARADLVRVAETLATRLKRGAEALKTWEEVESRFGEHVEAKLAFAGLHEASGDATAALAALDAAAKLATESERAIILGRTGSLAWTTLDNADRAFESFASALEFDPKESVTRGTLSKMLAHAPLRVRALELLSAANAHTQNYRAQFELTEMRMLAAESTAAQVLVLLDAAKIAEHQLSSAGAAFDLVVRAFLLDPAQEDLEATLLRLAGTEGRNHECITVFEDALRDPAFREASWHTRIHASAGSLIEAEGLAPDRALEHYIAIYKARPEDDHAADPMIRLAGVVRDWPVIAGALLVSPSEARARLAEAAASKVNGFEELTQALVRKLEKEGAHAAGQRTAWLCLARWYRDHLERAAAAESAFYKVLEFVPNDAQLLEELAHVQREIASEGLVATLVSLSQARSGDPELLSEAVRAATGAGREAVLLLFEKAAADRFVPNDATSLAYADQALNGLLELYASQPEEAYACLLRAAKLPLGREKVRELRMRAATLADQALNKVGDAVLLLKALLQEDEADEGVREALAALYVKRALRGDLVDLRRAQLARETGNRVAVTLQLADALSMASKPEESIAALRASLTEQPRATVLVDALVKRLSDAGDYEGLESLWASQGDLAEAANDNVRGATFYRTAADIAENKLSDVRRALRRIERAAALDPSVETLGNLARIASLAGEHSIAAAQLDRLRVSIPPDTRPSLVVQLASALVEIGDPTTAILRLEESTSESPDVLETREVLASLYRRVDDAQKLAPLLAETSVRYEDPSKVVATLREAATLFVERCKTPERAVPLLENALALVPDDRSMMLMLADAMGQSGDIEGAKRILGTALESFGGRKPKERALVHYYIARLHLISGDRELALAELETSTKIDPANAACLFALATHARTDGKNDKAERAYRALLSVLRRPVSGELPVTTRSEVLLALAEIAEAQGDVERATEIRESAFEAALESDAEADALEKSLHEHKRFAELSRLLTHRASKPDAKASVLWSLARLHAEELNTPEPAWPLVVRALRAAPATSSMLEFATQLATAQKRESELTIALEEAVELRLSVSDREAASVFLIALGHQALNAKNDDGALHHLARARSLGNRSEELLGLLDEFYGRTEQFVEQAEVLRDRLRGAQPEAVGALHVRRADLLGRSSEGVDEACEDLALALEANASVDAVQDVLRKLAKLHPMSLRVARMYEDQSRTHGNKEDLTIALTSRFTQDPTQLEFAVEALEVAQSVSAARASQLLAELRALAADLLPEVRSWIFQRSVEDATLRGAKDEVRMFAREAVRAEEGDARIGALIELAAQSSERGDLQDAAELYEEVLESEPSEERAWRPLLDLYRSMGRNDRLADLLEAVAQFDVGGDEVRAEFLWERAQLLAAAGRPDDVVEVVLLDVLEKSPGHAEAVARLVAYYKRAEQFEKLMDLCRDSAGAARDRGEIAAFGAISIELANALKEMGRGVEAVDVMRQALEDEPESLELLRYAVSLQAADATASERIELLERLLRVESGGEAASVARTLLLLSEEAKDEERSAFAIETGLRAVPGDAFLRGRAETLYRAREDWLSVGELYVGDAARAESVEEKVRTLRLAAQIFLESARDSAKAAEALKAAHEAAPDDIELRSEMQVAMLAEAVRTGDMPAIRALRMRMAMDAASANDIARAQDHAAAILELDGSDREALGIVAWCLSAVGRFDEAIDAYGRLVASASESELADVAMRYADTCERGGRLEQAVPVLERVRAAAPADAMVRTILLRAHEQAGRLGDAGYVSCELASLAATDEDRFAYLYRAGNLLFDSGAGVQAAIAPLEQALTMKQTDLDVVALLADAYMSIGMIREAADLLTRTIASQKGRRTRELGTLHHRMARVAQADGDRIQEVASLTTALDMDPQNGVAASELAETCLELGQIETAVRALRAVTLMKAEAPMPKSVAYYRLGEIAIQQGDTKRAIMQIKRALDEDSTFEAAQVLLAQLQPPR